MKKTVLLLSMLLVFILFGYWPINSNAASTNTSQETLLLNISNNTLNAFKNKDMNSLIKYVHPTKGVRFSSSTYVNVKKDIVLSKNELKNAFKSTKKYIWGITDGKGDNINLTFSDYYKEYIYDKDFLNAPLIGNDTFIGYASAINNAKEVYKNSKIIEYHFKGFNPEYAGFDWESLRLVFEKKNNNWYLVGVIHAQWTP